MAKLICELVPSVKKIRMTSSGTEACMSAIRLARGSRSATKIIKFDGCLSRPCGFAAVKAGSGALTSPAGQRGCAGGVHIAHHRRTVQ